MPHIEKDISVKDFLAAYQEGRRSFANVCLDASDQRITGIQLDHLHIVDSIFEVQLYNCSLKHSRFENSGIKCLYFEKCDLTGARISECAIECLNIVDCIWTDISFGENDAYGGTFNESDLLERLANNNRLW